MNCREFEADIVDLARGADLDAPISHRLGQHLKGCVGCAARLERERHLTMQLKELAGSAPPSNRRYPVRQLPSRRRASRERSRRKRMTPPPGETLQ